VAGSREHGNEPLVSIIRVIYWEAEELLASKEKSCSIELSTRYNWTTHLRVCDVVPLMFGAR
jgi:hypothetical protein